MIELPDGYYLTNFKQLLRFVDELYPDILSEAELDFSARFFGLDEGAARLFVRLISRKGPHFRCDKLVYPEIEDLVEATRALVTSKLVGLNEVATGAELLDLLTRPELESFARSLGLTGRYSGKRKQDLIDALLGLFPEGETQTLAARFYENYALLTPHGEPYLKVYRLLFFGNSRQDLTEFVLSDLGLLRYEEYAIDQADRLFNSRALLENTLTYAELSELAWLAGEAKATEYLETLCLGLPDCLGEASLKRRRDRILNLAGRALERDGFLERALAHYELAEDPPARERRARIHEKLGQFSEAYALCHEILAGPREEGESEFAVFFASKLAKKLGLKPSPPVKPNHPVETLTLAPKSGVRVEEVVLEHYASRDVSGFYAENHLWMSLFGLLFWDIIFMPVRGAFFNRYQRGPKGLFSPGFRQTREAAVRARLEQLVQGRDPVGLAETIVSSRHGVSNHFVNWDQLDWPLVQRVLRCLPARHLSAIFERFLKDPAAHRSGLPDLFLFDGSHGYQLLEVKGPGDQLQANQARWMRYFDQVGIPYKITRVVYDGA